MSIIWGINLDILELKQNLNFLNIFKSFLKFNSEIEVDFFKKTDQISHLNLKRN